MIDHVRSKKVNIKFQQWLDWHNIIDSKWDKQYFQDFFNDCVPYLVSIYDYNDEIVDHGDIFILNMAYIEDEYNSRLYLTDFSILKRTLDFAKFEDLYIKQYKYSHQCIILLPKIIINSSTNLYDFKYVLERSELKIDKYYFESETTDPLKMFLNKVYIYIDSHDKYKEKDEERIQNLSIIINEAKAERIAYAELKKEKIKYVKYAINKTFKIKDVRFSGYTTLVYWCDDTITKVTMDDSEDKYDVEKAIACAYMKRIMSYLDCNAKNRTIDNVFNKYLTKYEDEKEDIEAQMENIKKRKLKKANKKDKKK